MRIIVGKPVLIKFLMLPILPSSTQGVSQRAVQPSKWTASHSRGRPENAPDGKLSFKEQTDLAKLHGIWLI